MGDSKQKKVCKYVSEQETDLQRRWRQKVREREKTERQKMPGTR